jgi:hypothetical protein
MCGVKSPAGCQPSWDGKHVDWAVVGNNVELLRPLYQGWTVWSETVVSELWTWCNGFRKIYIPVECSGKFIEGECIGREKVKTHLKST